MFIIKKHYVATENNPNFTGQIADFYEGKGGHILCAKNKFPENYSIKEYGYSTPASAAKGLKKAIELAKWETGFGHWKVTAELIEVQLNDKII